MQPELSVIVPAFDESLRIATTLRAIDAHFAVRANAVELIVVDDGSRDDTAGVVRELAPSLALPLVLLRYAPNRGKGFALKVGFAASRGARVLFSDADLSTPIEEADALLAELERGFDVAIGSRKRARARVEVRQPWLRETLGKGFTLLVRWLVADVTDATCARKSGFLRFGSTKAITPPGASALARRRIASAKSGRWCRMKNPAM